MDDYVSKPFDEAAIEEILARLPHTSAGVPWDRAGGGT
jgi:hypothetical protein